MNRLFQIVITLLNKETVTAKELAEKLEVSTRTIYRDIDELSASGIPIYTVKGNGGGIALLDQYIMNSNFAD
ncbi:HTH domain-containing protein [Ureibacillus xyleni]|uniref:HTH domain-containing protein n=1 Tax=Ureibacillus xyleni TaxID=614648 RepID=A0A285TBK4_9BACL|nr:HTH domain-containing protein [Ureibacillus xyleni]SOC19463.1 HTH domain-containing protein [Ureibacillus xyleni]